MQGTTEPLRHQDPDGLDQELTRRGPSLGALRRFSAIWSGGRTVLGASGFVLEGRLAGAGERRPS